MWRKVEEARGKGGPGDDSHGADGGGVLVVMVMMVIAVMVMMVMVMVTNGCGGIFDLFLYCCDQIPENKPFEGSRMCFSS